MTILLCIVYFTKLLCDNLICNFLVWPQDRFASLKRHIQLDEDFSQLSSYSKSTSV
jgi:hypothetical protein